MDISTAANNGIHLQDAIESLKRIDTTDLSIDEYRDFNRSVMALIELHAKCCNSLKPIEELSNLAASDLPTATIGLSKNFPDIHFSTGIKRVVKDGEEFYQDSKGGLHRNK